ncbi:peptidase C13 family-domain-containing protein [Mycena epipterygia]|nr:peptidase C13 family-domain-containing protein [Mycena epipterygia]
MLVSVPHVLLFLFSWSWGILAATPSHEEIVGDFFNKSGSAGGSTSDHTNNWAVLVCASRYWFNYRHMANALGMYRTVKRLGIPDSNIILMLADDAACNARNKFPGSVYANPGRELDLYGDNIEVDYRGYEVTVENFIRVLTGRMEPSVPRSKRLLTDARSNIFVYMTGHGGNEFLKFQDNEEISAFDIADAFEQMYQKKRYNEIFFMIDTCQANTMYSKFYSPNILATGSSKLDQNSYSYENDNDIGVAVIDRYTHYVLEYMERINKTSHDTVNDLFASYDRDKILSDPGVRADLFSRPLDSVRLTDFFGGVAQVEVGPARESTQQQEWWDEDLAVAEESRPAKEASKQTNAREPRGATKEESWGGRWRAWGGVVLLGALVGWAGWK